MLADESKPFHVVCDTSDFAIGCALVQFDDDGRDYQSRQLKSAERNYPVHDKELLAMRYALVKFRVYLLGEQTDVSPHFSQRMARWLSFFSKYNFVVHHKPGKNNILADALSRRPDYDPRDGFGRQTSDAEDEDLCAMCVTSELNLTSYAGVLIHLRAPSEETLEALPRCIRSHIERYRLDGSLLTSSIDRFDDMRVVVPNDEDLRARIIREYHDAPTSGHLGREKTFAAVARDFFWPYLYKWLRKWVRTCETCQRVKPSPLSQAPLRPLPIPTEVWRSVSMDFVFGLQPDVNRRTGVLVFVDRFSKMVHLIPVTSTVTAEGSAAHFVDSVFRLRRLPDSIVSEHDPRFTSEPIQRETDGQTEHVNRVVEDVLRSYASAFPSWSSFQPLSEFALNNAEHSSMVLTPFFVNSARHPRVVPRGIIALLLVGEELPLRTYHGPLPAETSANAVTRSQAKKVFAAPRSAVTPLADWAERTLIDPAGTQRITLGRSCPLPMRRSLRRVRAT
ncbi:reverse transcriptase, partial [Phytophthora megakarya]